MININLLHEDAIVPSRGSDESAGLDFHTIESVTIPPGHRALLKTGVAMSMPAGYVGLIWPRSKLAAKMGIDVLAGVVDSDYRGEIMISLHYSDMQINIVDDLDKTMRGVAGVNSAEMRLR